MRRIFHLSLPLICINMHFRLITVNIASLNEHSVQGYWNVDRSLRWVRAGNKLDTVQHCSYSHLHAFLVSGKQKKMISTNGQSQSCLAGFHGDMYNI